MILQHKFPIKEDTSICEMCMHGPGRRMIVRRYDTLLYNSASQRSVPNKPIESVNDGITC